MIKSKLIKVVHEEAAKVGINPKILASTKGGQEFRKIQDAKIKSQSIEVIEETLMFTTPSGLVILRYERLKKIPEELRITLTLHAPVQLLSLTLGRKRKIQELEPETHIPGLECNIRLPEGIPFINNMVIEQSENGLFFVDQYSCKSKILFSIEEFN
ncbi:hypothetical protein Tco_1454824 [Tanacetum coccineum]